MPDREGESTSENFAEKDEEGIDKLGLVLGGGGARGFAHMGVLQALEDLGIEVDLVVGTSMGAVMGAALVTEADLSKLMKILTALDINKLLKVSSVGRREVEKLIGKTLGETLGGPYWEEKTNSDLPRQLSRMYRFFQLFSKDNRIEELEVPYAAVATDLYKGKEVVLREGKMYKAITASSAIPGFIPPVSWGDKLLADGGIVDKVPINVAIDMGADLVLAVDVGASLRGKPTNSIEVALRAENITTKELVTVKTKVARQRIDGRVMVLEPDVDDLNWLAFNQVEAAAARGRECLQQRAAHIKAFVKGQSVSSKHR